MGQFWRNIDTQPRSIPIGNGNVVAVRPQDVVEVEAETPTLARLKRQGKVARAGRPSNPQAVAKPEPVRGEVELRRANTDFAQRTAERGAVRGVDEARRVAAQAAAQRSAAEKAELAARAAAKAAQEAATQAEPVVEAVVESEQAPVAGEVPAAEAQLTDGTAEKSTMGKGKGKRRWMRADQ